jgi:hypothetical protein
VFGDQDSGFWILDSGFRDSEIQDSEIQRFRDSRSRSRDSRFKIHDSGSGFETQDSRFWNQGLRKSGFPISTDGWD